MANEIKTNKILTEQELNKKYLYPFYWVGELGRTNVLRSTNSKRGKFTIADVFALDAEVVYGEEKYLKPSWICKTFFGGLDSVVFPVATVKELYSKTIPNKINCIKLVRQLTTLGLKEAKDLVEDDLGKTGRLQPLYNLAYLQYEYKRAVLDKYNEAYKASNEAINEAYSKQGLSAEGGVSMLNGHHEAEKEYREASDEYEKAKQLIRVGEVVSQLPLDTQEAIHTYSKLTGGSQL